jgi:hypothetical protein
MPDVKNLEERVENVESVRVRDLRCRLEALANEASVVAEQADHLARGLRDRAQCCWKSSGFDAAAKHAAPLKILAGTRPSVASARQRSGEFR